MATVTNLKLNFRKPGTRDIGDEIVFTTVAADGDKLRIPYRYPFSDIVNYSALVTAGVFRHLTTSVDTSFGASASSGADTSLGFKLPPTEKLILLVKRNGVAVDGTAAEIFKVHGSDQYHIDDITKTWAADATFTSGSKIYEFDLFDFGLLIGGDSEGGSNGITIEVTDKTLEFALVARMY